MSTLTRQNTLFVAEDWVRIYEALGNVDFRAYDFDNLVQALMQYLRSNYPEEFNDWVSSSEFVTKIEILAWLSQNIAFRTDLNTRENFLATAERRDSLIRLAQNIGYRINRVRSAQGVLKLKSIRTTQSIVDSNGTNLQNRTILWNDPRDEDWFERFVLVLNQVFSTRTRFGSPMVTHNYGGVRTDQYVMNSAAPQTGTYRFSAVVNGVNIPFDIFNANLDPEDGLIQEIAPAPGNSFSLFYRLDGRGFNSAHTGFFLPFKQGNLSYQDEFFTSPEILRTLTLAASNVNNDDFFVQEIDGTGNVLGDWTQVDTTLGEGVSFNTLPGSVQNIYEVDTLSGDKVRVRFGDGSFGRIPVGRFRFWYRTANPTPSQIRPSAIQNQTISLPYTSNGDRYTVTMSYSLETTVSNGSRTETNDNIRTRAGKVFYTQNRMVTGQDYHNFFLKDSTIQKVKTVNRTFAGQSRYARLNDPTSLYQNVKHMAEDGRLFWDATFLVTQATANEDVMPPQALINNYVAPLIRKTDKSTIYSNSYTEVIISTDTFWEETSRSGSASYGRFLRNGNPVKIGNSVTGSSNLRHITSGSLIRFSGPKGPSVVVDRVIGDGTDEDAVVLRDVVENETELFSVFPPIRNTFTESENNELLDRIEQKLDFAIGWNQSSHSWVFINSDNINRTADFSIVNQGDTSGTAKDASWLIMLEYVTGNPDDLWTITDRGHSLIMESAREVDFIYTNLQGVVDPETGRSVRDSIVLLSSNESRDSLRRRGFEFMGERDLYISAYKFIGDGVTKEFQTKEVPLVAESTVVFVDGRYQIYELDYTIKASVSGYWIVFYTAPANGAEIEVRSSDDFKNARLTVHEFNGNGNRDEWALGVRRVNPSNVIVVIDGVIQNSNMDFGIGFMDQSNSIIFNDPLPAGTTATVHVLSGIDSPALTKAFYTGDGASIDFTIEVTGQNKDSVLVFLDGVMQSRDHFSLLEGTGQFEVETIVRFIQAPGDGVRVRIIAATNTIRTITNQYVFDADGSKNSFHLDENHHLFSSGAGIIVAIDGIVQNGPWSSKPEWSVTGGDTILFSSPPPADSKVLVFVISGAFGVVFDFGDGGGSGSGSGDGDGDGDGGNRGPLDVNSALVNFIGQEVELSPVGVIRHPDGYTNKNGLQVIPVDRDEDGSFDRPFLFRELVLQDGVTDLVLWRRVQQFGFNVFEPINLMTKPRGSYGNSGDVTKPAHNRDYDLSKTDPGDIHYDTLTHTWLVADEDSGKWKQAADQSAFKFRIGRDHLKFVWTHYAPEGNRIDPSKSNIMNVYILTSGFDQAYRTWLEQNGDPNAEPVPETSEQLRIQYQDFEQFKPISDSIIYYPARYKPLFGEQADPELQAVFKIIQTAGSKLSESDLKLRVLAAVRDYFSVDRWDFGERFYFTELVSFVHAQLAPDLQSMVIVPRNTDQAFGRLFQVRTEPDELFISAAGPEDIEVVRNFTDEELRIGTLI